MKNILSGFERVAREYKPLKRKDFHVIKAIDNGKYLCDYLDSASASKELVSSNTNLKKLRDQTRNQLFKKLNKLGINPDLLLEDHETLEQDSYHDNTYDCEMSRVWWKYMVSAYKVIRKLRNS